MEGSGMAAEDQKFLEDNCVMLCGDGACITEEKRCDGKVDCIDRRDEHDCQSEYRVLTYSFVAYAHSFTLPCHVLPMKISSFVSKLLICLKNCRKMRKSQQKTINSVMNIIQKISQNLKVFSMRFLSDLIPCRDVSGVLSIIHDFIIFDSFFTCTSA